MKWFDELSVRMQVLVMVMVAVLTMMLGWGLAILVGYSG